MGGIKIPIWKRIKLTSDYDIAYCGEWAQQFSTGVTIDTKEISIGGGISFLQFRKKIGEFKKEKKYSLK